MEIRRLVNVRWFAAAFAAMVVSCLQSRQSAMLHKGIDADDGVMTDVIGAPLLPDFHAGNEDASV